MVIHCAAKMNKKMRIGAFSLFKIDLLCKLILILDHFDHLANLEQGGNKLSIQGDVLRIKLLFYIL